MKDVSTINLFVPDSKGIPVLNLPSVKELIVRVAWAKEITSDQKRVVYIHIIETTLSSGKSETLVVDEIVGDDLAPVQKNRFFGAMRTWKCQSYNEKEGRPYTSKERKAIKAVKARQKADAENADLFKKGLVSYQGEPVEVAVLALQGLTTAVQFLAVMEQAVRPMETFFHEGLQAILKSRREVVEPMVGETSPTVPVEKMLQKAERVRISRKNALPNSAGV